MIKDGDDDEKAFDKNVSRKILCDEKRNTLKESRMMRMEVRFHLLYLSCLLTG